MTSTWRQILQNAARPRRLRVMMKKALKRTEPDTHAEALLWARERAISVEAWCKNQDSDIWNEAVVVCAGIEADGAKRLARIDVQLGGMGCIPLLYFLVRRSRPTVVVETGVAAGWTSRAILEGLAANGTGRLYSSDFPYFRLRNPEQYIGWVVPDDLRAEWHLDVRGDSRALPPITRIVDKIDLFHYDSDKSFSGRRTALNTIQPKLTPSSIVLIDDIQDNMFFSEWSESTGQPTMVFEYKGKFIGAVGL